MRLLSRDETARFIAPTHLCCCDLCSDSNFRRDKFLREKAAEDADGFVPLPTLLTFNRLKALAATLQVRA
jgi:hypothetical protein